MVVGGVVGGVGVCVRGDGSVLVLVVETAMVSVVGLFSACGVLVVVAGEFWLSRSLLVVSLLIGRVVTVVLSIGVGVGVGGGGLVLVCELVVLVVVAVVSGFSLPLLSVV